MNRQILRYTSSAARYTPQDPLAYPSSRNEIQRRVDKLKAQIEEANAEQPPQPQGPTLGNFKSAMFKFILLSSTVYWGLQWVWYSLDNEALKKENDELLIEYRKLIQEELDRKRSKSWFRFWER